MVKVTKQEKTFRMALLCPGLGHVKRGVETWTEDLGKCLYERGINLKVYKGGGRKEKDYEVVIPCLQRNSAAARWIVKNRPNILWRIGLGSEYTLEGLTFTLNVLGELIFRNFDIIHTQDPHVADFLRKIKKFGLINSKIILAHGTEEPFDFLARFTYLQHLAPFHLEEMKRRNKNGQKAYAIGNFVDTELYKPNRSSKLRKELNIPNGAFVVLCVAAIKKVHKRIDYLINEMSRLKNKKIYLILSGSTGKETEELIKLGKHKLKDRVIFLSDFPHERMQEVYSAADIFTICSLKEMMPIALLEATASGLPAIVHQYPVEEWMIGEGGDSIDMAKEGSLAKAIRKYMNEEYRGFKSKKARKQAVKNFSKDTIVSQILNMYQEVLGDKHE